jgi:hypothetical protein
MMKEHSGSGVHRIAKNTVGKYVHSSAVQDEGAVRWKHKADECPDNGPMWFSTGPCSFVHTALLWALICLKPPSCCPFILYHKSRTQAYNSPILLDSVPTTSPQSFPRPAQMALLKTWLIILFLFPIDSLHCVSEPMGTGCSFCPTCETAGTDLLFSISLMFCM